jgi:HD superfamily phosphohydrolase YqeK
MRSLPRRVATLYVGAVIVLGAAVVAVGFSRVGHQWSEVLILGGLFWIADSSPAMMRLQRLSISLALPIALAAILLLGPWRAAVVCLPGVFAGTHNAALVKRLFNSAQIVVSACAAGLVYETVPGGGVTVFSDSRFPAVLFPVVMAALSYLVVNYTLVALVISLTTRTRLVNVWVGGLSEAAVPSLGYGLLGLVTAVLWTGGVGPVAALLVLAPLLIARWAFQQHGEQHKAYEATVASLIRAVETKDYYTRGHSERVAKASVMLAEQLGMREDRLEMLRYAGMLHDVGKLGVPTKLLQKTGPLDDTEFAAIKLHPTRGVEMVNGIAFLNEAMLGIRHHHERVDGLGYPDGLAGEQIPEFARIIAVADAFDSMTSTRSYRSARSVEAAMLELKRWAGSQFDARMVDALIVAVEARGWETHVEPTDEVVDPAVLVFRDHDDPTSDPTGDIAVLGQPPYQRMPLYDEARAEVS